MVKEMEVLSLKERTAEDLTEQLPCGREEMIEKNIGLVHACAHRFQGRGIEYEDLFQAGCMGLIKATDAFDWYRGVRFSTYAVPVILGEMRRLFRDGGTVKVSRTLKELSVRVMRERELFYTKNGREPTVQELAQRMNGSVEDIIEAIGAAAPAISLTGTDEEDGQNGQVDIPVESEEERITDLLALRQAMGILQERDRSLIMLRYFQGKTQTETAKVLGMTQVQVSRREKKILLLMRQNLTGVS
jgi:RNA polymerase sporulation-specific sigma factor